MEPHKLALTKGAAGSVGVIMAWLDGAPKNFAFYTGAILFVLTATSLGLDIYKKWRHRKD